MLLRQHQWKWSERRSAVSYSLRPHGLCSPRNSPGQNTGVSCLSLLQGIFPTQAWNPGLRHCRRILSCLSHQGSISFFVMSEWLSTLHTPLFSVHSSADTEAASVSWLLQTVLQWSLGSTYPFEPWCSWGVCPGEALLDHMIFLPLVF